MYTEEELAAEAAKLQECGSQLCTKPMRHLTRRDRRYYHGTCEKTAESLIMDQVIDAINYDRQLDDPVVRQVLKAILKRSRCTVDLDVLVEVILRDRHGLILVLLETKEV